MPDSLIHIISKLSEFFVTDNFFCGKEQLDNFIKKYALVNQQNNIGQTWVLHEAQSTIIIGYYTLSTASVNKICLPSEYTSGLPGYPIPCVLLGKLAVDKKERGRGFGKQLLCDALTRTKEISRQIGCHAVIVDAVDDDAVNFYTKYGFSQFADRKLTLFLPVRTIP